MKLRVRENGNWWIVEEYMDYNSNIAVFGDHCRAIGIENELILDYTFFDDQDVFVLRRIT